MSENQEPLPQPLPISQAHGEGSNAVLEEFEIMPGLSVVIDTSKFRVKNAMKVMPQGTYPRVRLALTVELPNQQEAKVENIFSAESKR